MRIAQVATPDLYLTDTIKPDRELYPTHALQLAPNAPVLINHDEQRLIGRVVELDEWDKTDGRRTFARCAARRDTRMPARRRLTDEQSERDADRHRDQQADHDENDEPEHRLRVALTDSGLPVATHDRDIEDAQEIRTASGPVMRFLPRQHAMTPAVVLLCAGRRSGSGASRTHGTRRESASQCPRSGPTCVDAVWMVVAAPSPTFPQAPGSKHNPGGSRLEPMR